MPNDLASCTCGLQKTKQGRLHGKTVAEDWAGAELQKRLAIQDCDGGTDQPTYQPKWQGVESLSATKKKLTIIQKLSWWFPGSIVTTKF